MNKINTVYDVVLGFSYIEFPKTFSEEAANNFNPNPSNYIAQNKTNNQFYRKNLKRESSKLNVSGKSRVFLEVGKHNNDITSKLK